MTGYNPEHEPIRPWNRFSKAMMVIGATVMSLPVFDLAGQVFGHGYETLSRDPANPAPQLSLEQSIDPSLPVVPTLVTGGSIAVAGLISQAVVSFRQRRQ